MKKFAVVCLGLFLLVSCGSQSSTTSGGSVPVKGVTLSNASANIAIGATLPLIATISPSNASNQKVTWRTSNPSAATVSVGGVVTGVAAGTATITVTTVDGNYAATCAITVTQIAVTGVTLNKSSTATVAGGTEQLFAIITPSSASNQNVTWSSSSTAVATVSASGLVAGVTAGSSTITVTTADGNFQAQCSVTVSSTAIAVTGVSLNKTSSTVDAGSTDILSATITPSTATNQNVTWASSNSSIATVTQAGVVTGVTAGSATITVTTSDGGFSASCTETVSSNGAVFYGGNNETINATLQASGNVTANSRTVTVKVYVDNNMASANATTAAQAVLSNFIGNGGSSSIYGWITNIFGSEWGSLAASTYPTLLIGDSNSISILLYDIDGDQYTNTSGPWTVGFFWARDNYLRSSGAATSTNYSNQTLMFYIDLPFYLRLASGESSWSSTGYYPKVIYSTLAHEFQHMIHFYQKNIVYNSNSDTWFNEMCSVTAEDFVADKLGVQGPRGILDVNSAGTSGTTSGRLPLFNYDNTHSLINWVSNPVLDDYSMVYAFGAYLSRNHGGAQLFGKLVQSATPIDASSNPQDLVALTNAIGAVGGSETVDSLLRQWGAAVVLSDSASGLPSKAQYNTVSATTTTSGSVTYNLGPINLYNFSYSSATGPFFGSISAAINSMLNYIESLSSSGVSEVPSLPGKPEITESNRALASLIPRDKYAAGISALQNAIVTGPSATITSYNTTGTWDLSSNSTANQVSYLNSGVSSITITLGSTSRNLYLVFSNPTALTTAIPKVGSTSLTLNGLYTSMQPVSNAYYHIGSKTGTYSATLTVPSGVVVTMVAK